MQRPITTECLSPSEEVAAAEEDADEVAIMMVVDEAQTKAEVEVKAEAEEDSRVTCARDAIRPDTGHTRVPTKQLEQQLKRQKTGKYT